MAFIASTSLLYFFAMAFITGPSFPLYEKLSTPNEAKLVPRRELTSSFKTAIHACFLLTAVRFSFPVSPGSAKDLLALKYDVSSSTKVVTSQGFLDMLSLFFSTTWRIPLRLKNSL